MHEKLFYLVEIQCKMLSWGTFCEEKLKKDKFSTCFSI